MRRSRKSDPRAWRVAVAVARPPLMTLMKQEWSGGSHLPVRGGFLVAANHTSPVDPLVVGHFLHDHGITPHFLSKVEVFRTPVVGALLRSSGQIPVHRDSGHAADSYRSAVKAVGEGKCVVIYPEGTFTHDPDQWPMRAKTGAARIALQTRCPVIPLAQWGASEILADGQVVPRLVPRPTVTVRAGAPVGLSDLYERRIDRDLLTEATERIMDAITAEVAVIREEAAPAERWDPRLRRRVPRSALPGAAGPGLVSGPALPTTPEPEASLPRAALPTPVGEPRAELDA